MSAYTGKISSLGNYVTITTTIVTEDGQGRQSVGAFDRQKERFIDGLTIGGKTFGRLSCPSNLYPHFEKDKDAILYTWIHPFLGFPPIRTGIIGVAYPSEGKAYIITGGQMTMSLVALALLPLLWLIPGFIVGAILNAVVHLPASLTALVVALVALSPWIAGGVMAFNYTRMKAEHPHASMPS
jgi:hypothetical protein